MGQDELLALIEQAAVEGWRSLDLSGRGLKEIPEAIALIKDIGKAEIVRTIIN